MAVRSRECDLTTREGARRVVRDSFDGKGPTVVIHCAAAVGGIRANRERPGEFFFRNAAMAMNLGEEIRLNASARHGVSGYPVMVAVGSMTSYPASATIPFTEEDLWKGYPDAASAPYGVAKLAAWQMLDAYHRQYGLRGGYVVPVNLYGPGDNIADEKNAHVAGTLVRRIVEAAKTGAAEVVNWGTGAPTREFLFVEDAAEGVVRAAERAMAIDGAPTPINLGSGEEVSIKRLAEMIAAAAGYSGRISWDSSKPDGQARRCMNTTRAREMLGWKAAVGLQEGIQRTVEWYRGERASR
jgi:GDP-L-fucose synthase